MSLDEIGLLVGFSLLFGLAELLDQTHGLALEATVEPTACTSVDDITELIGREVEESERENIGLAWIFPFEFSVYLYKE
jgi:hypothetical protein